MLRVIIPNMVVTYTRAWNAQFVVWGEHQRQGVAKLAIHLIRFDGCPIHSKCNYFFASPD